ncbi:GAF domain-containing protein [Azospirillum griseum]|uniref:GAF domain-containing protein n=1 Tax=Azospirillum griseum TaxID=2496639 RepID=UPI00131552EF
MLKTQAAVFGLRIGHTTLSDVWKAACEDIAESTGASRTSLWVFDHAFQSLTCVNLYDRARSSHAVGGVLRRGDHPDYFRAITNNAKVIAPDALTHPATRGFSDAYFKPHDVRSLLDCIVLRETVAVGVLCCEQSGAERAWRPDDIAALQAVAMLIGTVCQPIEDPA